MKPLRRFQKHFLLAALLLGLCSRADAVPVASLPGSPAHRLVITRPKITAFQEKDKFFGTAEFFSNMALASLGYVVFMTGKADALSLDPQAFRKEFPSEKFSYKKPDVFIKAVQKSGQNHGADIVLGWEIHRALMNTKDGGVIQMGIDLLLIDVKTGGILKKKKWDETISLQGDPMTGQYNRPSPEMLFQGYCKDRPCGQVAQNLDASPYMSTEASAEATPFRLLANEIVEWLEKLPPPVRETQ